MNSGELTPDVVNRAVVLAWTASLFIAAMLTVPVFLLHRHPLRSTNMRALSAVLAIPCALAVYVLAGISLVGLVDLQLRPEPAQSGNDFSLMSIHYHPGLRIKLSLLGTVVATWVGLVWRQRVKIGSPPTVA